MRRFLLDLMTVLSPLENLSCCLQLILHLSDISITVTKLLWQNLRKIQISLIKSQQIYLELVTPFYTAKSFSYDNLVLLSF